MEFRYIRNAGRWGAVCVAVALAWPVLMCPPVAFADQSSAVSAEIARLRAQVRVLEREGEQYRVQLERVRRHLEKFEALQKRGKGAPRREAAGVRTAQADKGENTKAAARKMPPRREAAGVRTAQADKGENTESAARKMPPRSEAAGVRTAQADNGEDTKAAARKMPPRSEAAGVRTAQVDNGEDTKSAARKTPPRSRSAEAVYEEQHALFQHKLTIEPSITYSYSADNNLNLNGFYALGSIFLGSLTVQKIKSHTVTLGLLTRYGFTPRFQMDLDVPVLYRQTTYLGQDSNNNSVERTTNLDPQTRLGDVSLGFNFRLLEETVNRPDLVTYLRIKAPTGEPPYGMKTETAAGGNLQYPSELPSGNGVWAASLGFSTVKTVDPAILFANLGYTYNFSHHFADISSTPGVTQPGRVNLGNSIQLGMGIAFALNETTSISIAYSQSFIHKTRLKYDGGNWQDIPGSEANPALLSIGGTHALGPKSTMGVTVGVGLTPDAPNVQVSVRFPFQF